MKKNNIINSTGFWTDEKCEYCNGKIIEKITELPKKIGKNYILIKNVPTGVCKSCGSKYYTANVLKTIQELVREKKKPKSKLELPVYSM